MSDEQQKYLIFRGEAKTFTNKTSLARNEDYTIKSKNPTKCHEVYIDNSTLLRGEGVLPAGTHTYTFSIPLPLECPSSLDENQCYLRYELTLTVTRVWSGDYVFSKTIKVLQMIDLNLHLNYRLPIRIERIAPVGCWPSRSSGIKYTITTPQAAYVPGQIVSYALLIENQSMYDIHGYVLQFSQIYTFKCKSAHYDVKNEKKFKNILTFKSYEDKCLRLTTRKFESNFLLPPMIPTTLNNIQHIIRVEYQMKITVPVSGCYGNHKLTLPIVIGTVPIRDGPPHGNSQMRIMDILCGSQDTAHL